MNGLDKAITILDQLTALAGAGVPLITTATTVIALIKQLSTGADQNTAEEAEAAVARWHAAEDEAIARNDEWRATHPRV